MSERFRWWIRGLSFGLGAIAVLAGAVQLYSVMPASFVVPPLEVPQDTRELVLIFHGSRGRNEPTLIQLEQKLRAEGGDGRSVIRYIWSPFSDQRMRTYPNGRRIGRELGAELATLPDLQRIHLLAHSAGSYVLDPVCESYREAQAKGTSSPARIRMTFLDPIGFRGPFERTYGAAHFGACADEAEAFINTDDPVPATASPLKNARTLDVTNDDSRKQFSRGGHYWPIQYYLDSVVTPVLPAQ